MAQFHHARSRSLRILLVLAPAIALVGGRASAQSAGNGAAPLSGTPLNLPDSALTGAAPFGTAVRLGALPTSFASGGALSSPAALPTGLEIIPSIGLSEQALFGGFPQNRGINNEFITRLTPGLTIVGTAPIGRISLSYLPSFEYYAREPRDSGVNQSLNGSFSTTLIPHRLTLNASAYLTEQATAGGLTPGGSAAIGPNARTTTQSYLISPQYRQRFIGAGALDLLYSAQYTSQSGRSATLPGNTRPYFIPNDVFAQTGRFQFTTIPLVANTDDRVLVIAVQDIGTGVLNGAQQFRAEDQIRYAFRPRDLFIVSGGYQALRYKTVPPVRIDSAIWSVGVDLHPYRHFEIDIAYRHRDGFNAPYLRATVPITPRTRLSTSYSETLSTQAQGIAAGVAGSTVNFGGQSIGSTGQSPLLLTNNTLSVQSGLFRIRQFSIATETRWARDQLSFNFLRSAETLVANAPGTAGFSQRDLSASVNFSHELTRNATIAAYFDYSRLSQSAAQRVSTNTEHPIYTGALTGSYRTAHDLLFDLQLAVTNSSLSGVGNSFGATGNGLQTSITFGVQKVF